MNKLVKVCAAVLAVGAVLCIGGAAAGGTLYGRFENGRLRPSFHAPEVRVSGSGRDSGSYQTVHSLPEIDRELDDLDAIDSLRVLDFELGAANYTIVEGEAYGLEYNEKWRDNEIESYIDDGVWYIRTGSKWLDVLNVTDRHCTITVPAGCSVDSLILNAGAGNVEVDAPISAKEAEITVGGANLDISLLNVRNDAEVYNGAGNLDIGQLTLGGDLSIENGAGNVEIDNLSFGGSLDLENGASNTTLGLAGSWEDYHLHAEVAMGTITLNGKDLVTGLSGECFRGSGSKEISAEVSMGNLDIFTDNE